MLCEAVVPAEYSGGILYRQGEPGANEQNCNRTHGFGPAHCKNAQRSCREGGWMVIVLSGRLEKSILQHPSSPEISIGFLDQNGSIFQCISMHINANMLMCAARCTTSKTPSVIQGEVGPGGLCGDMGSLADLGRSWQISGRVENSVGQRFAMLVALVALVACEIP